MSWFSSELFLEPVTGFRPLVLQVTLYQIPSGQMTWGASVTAPLRTQASGKIKRERCVHELEALNDPSTWFDTPGSGPSLQISRHFHVRRDWYTVLFRVL